MRVTKRTGKLEEVSFDKVIKRLKKLCDDQPTIDIDVIYIAQKVVNRIYDGVKTTELDELAARTCASAITENPKYGELASRIIISNNHKNTSPSFSETISGDEISSSIISSSSTFNTAIKSLTGIFSVPSEITIFSIIPSSGDSSSIVALSVSISAIMSPELTV